MKSRLIFTIFCLLFSLFLSLPLLSHAQPQSSIDGVRITAEPSTPAPGQNTVISVESFITDLNAASIVWLVNGKNYAQGTGRIYIGIAAPALGKTTSVVAVIMTVEGKEVKKAISIKSGDVDLIWESAGYVPPFYRGKAFFAYENPIKITAIPHLAGSNEKEIDARTLVYKWTLNDKVIQDQSGYGKQTLLIQEELPRELDIKVEVGTRNGSEKAAGFIKLSPSDPAVSLYEEDPLYGVLYNKALKNEVKLANQEITIRAVPYSFTIFKNTPLTFNWSINSLQRNDLSTNESIILRTRGDAEGTSNIALEVRSANNILQGARNSINVLFSKKSSVVNSPF